MSDSSICGQKYGNETFIFSKIEIFKVILTKDYENSFCLWRDYCDTAEAKIAFECESSDFKVYTVDTIN